MTRRRFTMAALLLPVLLAAHWVPMHLPLGAAGTAGSTRWPQQGQAAVAWLPDGRVRTSGSEQPVPIASLAKVMTALITLRQFPLAPGSDGFVMTVTPADVVAARVEAAEGESVVAVSAGERLTERQALEALLLPSANNIAWLLADHGAGTGAVFAQRMNAQAAALDMTGTTYTDPSGYESSTVSTAADQTRLARAAAHDATLMSIAGMRQASLPVVGTVTSTDALLGEDGFIGLKTGSDEAAGGCFMFAVRRHGQSVVGAVLGQRGGPLIAAGLDAAQRLVDRL